MGENMDKLKCAFCGDPVDPKCDFRKVTGWECKRTDGGTNALRLREQHDEWAHKVCVDMEARKLNSRQQSLI
jgi:hypothetical protein